MSDSPAEWSYTRNDLDRAKRKEPFFEEPSLENRNGVYRNRPIIGRDTPINGCVYLGGGSIQEGIVVDDKTQPKLLEVYEDLVDLVKQNNIRGLNHKDRALVLQNVYYFACRYLPYDAAKVQVILDKYGKDRKVALDIYLGNKAGVCRHQALLCGYLLEKLISEHYIQGSVSVDRNFIPGGGGHAWTRYTNPEGKVYIIDPAQHFVGELGKVPKDAWFYKRPTDK